MRTILAVMGMGLFLVACQMEPVGDLSQADDVASQMSAVEDTTAPPQGDDYWDVNGACVRACIYAWDRESGICNAYFPAHGYDYDDCITDAREAYWSCYTTCKRVIPAPRDTKGPDSPGGCLPQLPGCGI